MTGAATALAHPNIALSKYWGKRARPGNFPAVPSLSLTLTGLSTRTTVAFRSGLAGDRFVLGGRETTDDAGNARARVVALLDRVRAAANVRNFAEVESVNDFPTASGLASSASGFAALALAAVRAAGLEWDAAAISDLARRSSASAARSLFGGWVELPAGSPLGSADETLSAVRVAPETHLELDVLVCVTTDAAKAVSSTLGMVETARTSPYFSSWLDYAPRVHERLREALAARDIAAIGECAEASMLAMHASAMAAGVVYMRDATIAVFNRVRDLRAGGAQLFATVDAGPHVKVFVHRADRDSVHHALNQEKGIVRILASGPGGPAHLIEETT